MGENHFWVTTVPRTGSMWTFNAVRGLAQISGKQVVPAIVPVRDETMFQIYDAAQKISPDNRLIYTYKVHVPLLPGIPNSKYLSTIRDPRETVVSHMRFVGGDFDAAFKSVKGLRDLADHYSDFGEQTMFMVNYDDIVRKPVHVVKNIAKFMNIDVSDAAINKVASNLDPVRVRSNIAMNDLILENKIEETGEVHASEVVTIGDSVIRAFDVKTGFQTGHVSEMTREDYRASLTQDQVEQINDFFGDWLERYGFSREF